MADRFCALRAFANGQLAVVPLGDGGNQLGGVLMLRGAKELGIDGHRSLRKRLVCITRYDLVNELLYRRVGLVDRFGPGRVERHAERIGRISRADERGALNRRFERVGDDERDRLAAIGDCRREHRLQALKSVATRHEETCRFHVAQRVVRKDQLNTGQRARRPGVQGQDASSPDRRYGERRMQDLAPTVVGREQCFAADLVACVDAWRIWKWQISHRRQALCLAIINASTTVLTASSILNPLSRSALAPCSAVSPADRAASEVNGRPINIRSAWLARHGRVATPPIAILASSTVPPLICNATAAEASAKA